MLRVYYPSEPPSVPRRSHEFSGIKDPSAIPLNGFRWPCDSRGKPLRVAAGAFAMVDNHNMGRGL